MTAIEIYLLIGVTIGLIAVLFCKTKELPTHIYAMTLLVVILLWPMCLLGGYLSRRRQND